MKTKIQIKSFWGGVLFEFEKDDNTIKDTLVEAAKQGAYLRGADLREADLQGAYLQEADLQGAYLQEADLQGAYLRGADLRGAYLQGADLRGADLRGAYLREAYLREADLQGAYLQEADLQEAYLQGAKNLKKIYQSDLSILNNQVNLLRAFKFLTEDMESPINTPRIKYEVGKEFKEKINKDKLEECGQGLNVATLEWCLREASCDLKKKYIEVEFDPKDIIVPYFSDGKFRVSKLKVIRVLPLKELKEAMSNI